MFKEENIMFKLSEKMIYCVSIIIMIAAFGLGFCILDQLDRHSTNAKVFTVYEDSGIEFITDDGNVWLVDTDDTTGIKVGDNYKVTFKEYENTNIYDDAIVDYEPLF